MDINSDLSCNSRVTDTNVSLGSSQDPENAMALYDNAGYPDQLGFSRGMALRHQHGYWVWPRPQVSLWYLVLSWVMDTNTDSSCGSTMDTDMVLSSSLDSDVTMAPDGNAGHPGGHSPHCTMTF